MVPTERRQTSWINPTFQGKFVKTLLLMNCVAMVVGGLILATGWFLLAYMPAQLDFPMPVYFLVFLVCAGALGAVITYMTVEISHRICGPVHRVLQVLESVQRNEHPGPVMFRQTDYFYELEESVNATLDMLYDHEVFETFKAPEGRPVNLEDTARLRTRGSSPRLSA